MVILLYLGTGKADSLIEEKGMTWDIHAKIWLMMEFIVNYRL